MKGLPGVLQKGLGRPKIRVKTYCVVFICY